MLHLLDARTKQSKLSGLLAEQMKLPALTGKSCSFYAITCYFGFDAAKKLAAELYRAAKQAKVNLTGFHILYEAREWAKQRTDEQTATIEAIKKLLRIPSDDRCTLPPVSATHNDLMHSKVYALIDESKRAGIVVTTSGNLTAPGLGINSKDRNNMEIAKVSGGAQDVSAFQDVFSRLSSMGIDEASVLKHDDFLFAVRLLSLGVFYHQWQGSLASEVRFSLKLSEYGKQRAREGNEAFRSRGYEVERNTVSKDPLGLERIFIKVPKPFPAEFTRMFCVDTLLGRWFPERVAGVMDCKLAQDVEPYMEKLALPLLGASC